MNYKRQKFLLSAVASSLMLAGCGGSSDGDSKQIEANTYQAPTVVNCDDLQNAQLFAADEFVADVQCVLSDTSGRNLSASQFKLTLGSKVETGTAAKYDADSGVATFAISTFDDAGTQLAEVCITPKSNTGNNNIGSESCFVMDTPVADYKKPFISSYDELPNMVRIDNTVNAQYLVSDSGNGEHARAVTAELDWYLDDEAQGITSSSINVESAWVGKRIKYCVVPKTVEAIGANTVGEMVCSSEIEILPGYREEAPQASASVSFGSENVEDGQVNTVPVLAGEVLTASYTFEAGLDNEIGGGTLSKEGVSPAVWQRTPIGSKTSTLATVAAATPELIKKCDFSGGAACDYTVQQSDLGYRLEFCVTPTTENTTTGSQVCSGTDVFGVKLSGTMEYLQTLTADVYGYDLVSAADSVNWYVDTAHSPENDELRTLAVNADITTAKLHSGRQFEIAPVQGLREAFEARTIWEQAGVDSKRRGGISDWSWDKFITDGVLGISGTTPDANNFIGKEIRACLEIKGASENTCFNISEQAGVDGKLDYTTSGVASSVVSGIAPVKLLDVASDDSYRYIHHRPLTLKEGNDLTGTIYSTKVNDIEWAQFIQQTWASGSYNSKVSGHNEDALLSCLNLTSGGHEWWMPVFDATMSIKPESGKTALNIYSSKNTLISSQDGESLSNYDGIVSLGFKIKPLTSSAATKLSAATGWPLVSNGDKEQVQKDMDNATKNRTFVAGYGTATVVAKAFYVGQSWAAIDKTKDASGGEKYIWKGATSSKSAVPLMSCVTKVSL